MSIRTESIKMFLEDTFKKKVDDIKISDMLSVQSITIDALDMDNNKSIVQFDEIKNFKNTHYLELCNLYIDDSIFNTLSYLPYIESIVFRNCVFSSSLSVIKNKKIRKITVDSCEKFKFIYFSNISSLSCITIKNTSFTSFNGLRRMHLKYLEIIGDCLISRFNVSYLNADNFVLSRKIYRKYSDILNQFNSNILIYSDEGFYIEEQIEPSSNMSLVF